jgi:hypothetical protein
MQKRWSRAQVFVVRGRALHLVAAFHFSKNHLKIGNAFEVIYFGMRWVIQETL